MRALVLLTVALLTVVLVGCGASPNSTLGPSTGPNGQPTTAPTEATNPSIGPSPSQPTPAPTPAPTPTGAPAPIVLAKESLAKVLVDKVVVFQKPQTPTDYEPFEEFLNAGDRLFIVDGPVTSDGRQWYLTAPAPSSGFFEVFGWVATTAANGTAQLGAAPTACPTLPIDYAQFMDLTPVVGLSCFGDRKLTFAARLAAHEATCGVSPGWTTNPEWLGPCEPHDYVEPPRGNASYLDAVFAPSLDTSKLHYGINPTRWLMVRITGQFDYPAARTCRGVRQDSDPPSPAEIILGCRKTFVITKVEPLS